MPRIFDNIKVDLLPALQETLNVSDRADFCVGYFNLRGWKTLDAQIERFTGGDGHCCRLLVGMQKMPQEQVQTLLGLGTQADGISNSVATRLRKELVDKFREQLTFGSPTNEDEAGLRRLAAQIKAKKVTVKLFLAHSLHAKLYLLFRPDPITPTVGYLGSSNLTLSGLSKQGELNVDVVDQDSTAKLAQWFEDRWNDRFCVDISDDLLKVIGQSWAREDLIPPYHIYVKMAYHLSREAREGISEFKLPAELRNKLFEFQQAAVKIAAHHLKKRGGVLIGDVVGLGKTLMATAVARLFEEELGIETLIICPKNLEPMWENYRDQYLRGKVLRMSMVTDELPTLRRYRLVIIDESHHLRTRDRKRYNVIRDYIRANDCKCILLSATPYNKTYLDLANQLRLFLDENKELSVRPERLLKEMGITEFNRKHQCIPHSLAAFEKSEHVDDWRELMRLYLVRRTRTFILSNYAKDDPVSKRKYLPAEGGKAYYFPNRIPKTAKFTINDGDPNDPYARLYAQDVVAAINHLHLPRYGMGNHVLPAGDKPPTPMEARFIQNLSRAGNRLKGFSRTNLFKRLESSGWAFLQSLERHILRNFVFLHAIEKELDLPIGTQDSDLLDIIQRDDDSAGGFFEDEDGISSEEPAALRTIEQFRARAVVVYGQYATKGKNRFDWLRSSLFDKDLAKNLLEDATALIGILQTCGQWEPTKDAKLNVLHDLLAKQHPKEKIIVFSQFADTVNYLEQQLQARGIKKLSGATGESSDPTALAWRFSPLSNERGSRVKPDEELRILIATDVLSEGQNLQDCAIVINYDLPWAIIRLIQRIGRIDRIGQSAERILCYSFLPADGVERIIRLRDRVRQRLKENAEVVGTDEAFFEDDLNNQAVRDLFTEKAGLLDKDIENEVDLASYAWQIWQNATTKDPTLKRVIPELPAVVFSTKQVDSASRVLKSPTDKERDSGKETSLAFMGPASATEPNQLRSMTEGVLVYLRTTEDNDALVWMDKAGNTVTESQKAILDAAECTPDTPGLPRLENHHDLVLKGVQQVLQEERTIGGQLGRPSGARFKTYERLKEYAKELEGTLFGRPELRAAIDSIYRHPLRETAKDELNRMLRTRATTNEELADKVIALYEAETLCVKEEDGETRDPRIICSMGLRTQKV